MARAGKREKANLADHRRALDAACKELPRLVVLHGKETCLRGQALGRLRLALCREHPGIQVTDFDGQDPDMSVQRLVQELAGNSLFASEKLLLLRRADRLLFPSGRQGDDGGKQTTRRAGRRGSNEVFIEYLQRVSGTTWIILDVEKLDQRRRLGKAITAKAALIPCPEPGNTAEVAAWLRAEASGLGKRVEAEAVDLLLATHDCNLGGLHSELVKLATYAGERGDITRQDVLTFLSGSMEFDVFSLTNAVEARTLPVALEWARRVSRMGLRDTSGKRTNGRDSVYMAMAMLARSFTLILRARVLGGGRVDQATITRIQEGLRLNSPWRAKHLAAAAARYPISELRQLVRSLAREMQGLHHTDADPPLALERMVLAACGTADSGPASMKARRP